MTIILIISCLASLFFGILSGLFCGKEISSDNAVSLSIKESDLPDDLKPEIEHTSLHIKTTYYWELSILFFILWTVTCLVNTYFIVAPPDSSLWGRILLTVMFSLLAMITSMFIIGNVYIIHAEETTKIPMEDILKVYFKKTNPELTYLFVPIYTNIYVPENRLNIKAELETYYGSPKTYLFGKNLVIFAKIFEKAFKNKNTESVFTSEILKDENVSILAKLLIILSDPLLKEQIVLNKLDSAKEFNKLFSDMVYDIKENVENIKRIDEQLIKSEQELSKQKEAQQVREKLDFLIQQKFK